MGVVSEALAFRLFTPFKILGWCEHYGVWRWWWWGKEGDVRCLEKWDIPFSVCSGSAWGVTEDHTLCSSYREVLNPQSDHTTSLFKILQSLLVSH